MKYTIIKKDDKEALFDSEGNQISEWFDYIFPRVLSKEKPEVYVAQLNNKVAIFDIYKNQISDWYDGISLNGLVRRASIYYTAELNNKYAIFDINKNQITRWISKEESLELFGEEALLFSEEILDIESKRKSTIKYKRKLINKIIENPYKYKDIIKFFIDCYKKGYILHKMKGFEDILKINKIKEGIIKIISQKANKKKAII